MLLLQIAKPESGEALLKDTQSTKRGYHEKAHTH